MSFLPCKKPFLPSALIAGLCLLSAGPATAQTLTNLLSFDSLINNNSNNFGAYPVTGLIVSVNTLYGTAVSGGENGNGTVFAINTDSTDFKILHTFSAFNNTTEFQTHTNGDGASPNGGLILSGNLLYGTTISGGTAGEGTVFALNLDNTNFTTLYNFTNGTDGASPSAGLVLAGDMLYGTASYGGSAGSGTIFALNTNYDPTGAGFATLYTFTNGSDGSVPWAALVLSGSTLYSTAVYGGGASNGTVFAINTNGSGFTVLHAFSAESNGTNRDGAYPFSPLVISGGILYGTATQGGNTGHGTVFAINTSDTNFTPLHDFSATPLFFNSDGALPYGGLVLSGDILYGTAKLGGKYGLGTAFSVSTTGSGFTTLANFGQGANGAWPLDGLVLSDGALYGTASFGGKNNVGAVFKLSGGSIKSPPPLPAFKITLESRPPQAGAVMLYTWSAPDYSVFSSGEGAKSVSVPSGYNLYIAVSTPNDCYQFKSYTIKAATLDYTSQSADLNVNYVINGNGTIVVDFTEKEYDIQTASLPIAGGTVTGGGTKACGSLVTLRATAKAGFKFTNWISNGTILGNKSPLTFNASVAETVTANFLDDEPPKVTITSPASGFNTTDANLTVLGKASDNVAVANVYYRLGSSGAWTLAQQTSAGWATWSAPVTLTLGANVVEVYAVDFTGNASAPVSVKITLVAAHP